MRLTRHQVASLLGCLADGSLKVQEMLGETPDLVLGREMAPHEDLDSLPSRPLALSDLDEVEAAEPQWDLLKAMLLHLAGLAPDVAGMIAPKESLLSVLAVYQAAPR